MDLTIQELARRGYEEFRAMHAFAMRAIVAGASSASELGRALSVSKQAAAKTISILEKRGLVRTVADTSDGRRKRLEVTKRGLEVLLEGETIFDEMRANWAKKIGPARLRDLESCLLALVGTSPTRLDDIPGWPSEDRGNRKGVEKKPKR